MKRFSLALVSWLLCALAARAGERIEIGWPTPNRAWEEGRPARDFLQQAGSGDPESGGFGGVRSGGRQFHEGVDIRAVARDRRGEPKDEVFAAMAGVVRHVNHVAGNSSYGRYIVIEHTELSPAVYTLYAHLARIEPGVREGGRVNRGQTIGVMGHSSGGYMIPTARAHLHFEIGLAATSDFQRWYASRGFGSPNQHGMWNGFNLLGIDPVDFMGRWRRREVDNFQEYFASMETAVRLRIATRRVPDFVRRYPALVTRPLPMIVGGWEIRFNWTGLPFSWTPLTGTEVAGLALNRPELVEVNEAVERRERSKTLAVRRLGGWAIADDLRTVLQQMFGVK